MNMRLFSQTLASIALLGFGSPVFADGTMVRTDEESLEELNAFRKKIDTSGRGSVGLFAMADELVSDVAKSEDNVVSLDRLNCYRLGCSVAFRLKGNSNGMSIIERLMTSKSFRAWPGPMYWSPVINAKDMPPFVEFILFVDKEPSDNK